MKICAKCKVSLPLEAFSFHTIKGKNRPRSRCKKCRVEDQRIYEENNKEAVIASRKLTYKNHKEERRKKGKIYKDSHKEEISEWGKGYYQANAEEIKADVKAYRKENPEKIRDQKRGYEKERYDNDLEFRIKVCLRARFRAALKNNAKNGSAVKDLGCTVGKLKARLESMFQPGMTWDNYGPNGWHIDHIKPLAKFDLTDRSQLLKACHYTNLQPLWREDNLKKGAR